MDFSIFYIHYGRIELHKQQNVAPDKQAFSCHKIFVLKRYLSIDYLFKKKKNFGIISYNPPLPICHLVDYVAFPYDYVI